MWKRIACIVIAVLAVACERAKSDKQGVSFGGTGTKVEPKSGLAFVHLPGGTFHYGCEPRTQCQDDEKPGRDVTVQAMWMGKTDVTVAAYAKCVSAGACTAPDRVSGAGDWTERCNWTVKGNENHPINCIGWNQAKRFCQWIGGRLPTAEEWEFAAKGGESRIYPWGNGAIHGNLANYCDKNCPEALPVSVRKQWEDNKFIDHEQDDGYAGTSPVGSYPAGASKFGLLDMAGNVYQWTGSDYSAGSKEARGGSWGDTAWRVRASNRRRFPPEDGGDFIGVRCCL